MVRLGAEASVQRYKPESTSIMLDQLNIEVIPAVRTAIGRSRIMTTLLAIASVLATIAYWNGRENSWGRARNPGFMKPLGSSQLRKAA